jgi:hypothetical protein
MMDEWPVWGVRTRAGAMDATLARADAVVRELLDDLNRALLGGRGTLMAAPMSIAPGAYLWELWWESADGRERYVMVSLLRDSRGTPYVKVQRRRLSLHDTLLLRRLRWALEDAMGQPWVHAPTEAALLSRLDELLGVTVSRTARRA